MKIKYKEIGICGLSCRFCPHYHVESVSRCRGCKSPARIALGCPFITCAVKRRGLEFCWDCPDQKTCDKWKKHRLFSKAHDTFVSYQKLEDNIAFIKKHDILAFEKEQKIKEKILKQMLKEFNEGRSKSYYCIAVTVMKTDEIKYAIKKATKISRGLNVKDKSKLLHSILDNLASQKDYCLKLRK